MCLPALDRRKDALGPVARAAPVGRPTPLERLDQEDKRDLVLRHAAPRCLAGRLIESLFGREEEGADARDPARLFHHLPRDSCRCGLTRLDVPAREVAVPPLPIFAEQHGPVANRHAPGNHLDPPRHRGTPFTVARHAAQYAQTRHALPTGHTHRRYPALHVEHARRTQT